MFLLTGVARYLFVPLAEAVVFAMLTSYLLSRTLVPTLAKYWLRKRAAGAGCREANPRLLAALPARLRGPLRGLRDRYHEVLTTILARPRGFMPVFLGAAFASMLLIPLLGRNFFPEVDSGQIKLHMRAPTGTRVEDTAAHRRSHRGGAART